MKLISEEIAVRLFLKNPKPVYASEDFDVLELRYEDDSLEIPSETDVQEALAYFLKRDTFQISFTIGDSDAIVYSASDNFDEITTNIEVKLRGFETGQKVILTLKIYKSHQDNTISLYSFDLINKYFNQLTFEELIILFADRIKLNGSIIFVNETVGNLIQSNSIGFVSGAGVSTLQMNKITRKERLDAIHSVTSSTLFSKYQILPDDFLFPSISTHLEILNRLNKIGYLLTIAAIFDITNIRENEFEFKLNGYKTITGRTNLNDLLLDENLHEYHEIYQWVYQLGSIVDKIGLSRNIISLHLKKDQGVALDGHVYESILSGYKLYEKQNIKQYIEVRNKMSDQLLDYGKRANQIIETFASGFQKSSLAVMTFFASVLALKILGSQSTTIDFIIYSSLLSMVFLIFSLVYMFIARWEVKGQKKRFMESYKDFKARYTDLLTVGDINLILNNDKEHKKDVDFISQKLKWYTCLWIVLIILIFIAIAIYFYYQSAKILKETGEIFSILQIVKL